MKRLIFAGVLGLSACAMAYYTGADITLKVIIVLCAYNGLVACAQLHDLHNKQIGEEVNKTFEQIDWDSPEDLSKRPNWRGFRD